jgi:general stress protein 26
METQRAEHLTTLAGMIDDIEVAMLTTVDGGELRSRPMATQKLGAAAELWFFTRKDAPKVGESTSHPVAISYAQPGKNRYVSVSGRASLVVDQQRFRELWNDALTQWFPGGVDDPELALLRVDIDAAEYWDAPARAFIHIPGFAKSVKHEKLTL